MKIFQIEFFQNFSIPTFHVEQLCFYELPFQSCCKCSKIAFENYQVIVISGKVSF